MLGGRVKGSQWPPQNVNSMIWGERIKSQPSCVRLTAREERQQLACPGSQCGCVCCPADRLSLVWNGIKVELQ